jgi:UDP-3-O-[3-hydroxymyristoyl] N-acetylglucosamine deacetylase/3-hydroxyacyl-[acyl-carrier-protein] dehydratase
LHVQQRQQRTLKRPVKIEGVGLHTGKRATAELRPAEPGNGITFVRVDIDSEPEVPASGAYLKTRERRTCLFHEGAEVFTVEHLLAALSALQVDNVQVRIDAEEVPGLDGSAVEFVQKILEAGFVEQRAPRKVWSLNEPIYLSEGDASLVAVPGRGGLSIDYNLDFPEGVGQLSSTRQTVSFRLGADTFAEEIAPARTFVFEREIEQLQAAGLGKGADTSNTLVMSPAGPRDNELRFPDELARHKVLDLLGDLALTGVQIHAHIIATRSGHRTNHLLVKQLLERMRQLEDEGYLTRKSGMNIRDILGLLPHRYPFLLVDRVVEIEGYRRAVGIKNVTFNEPFFQGHWPGQPIMPGVLQLEAMAQMSGLLLFRKLENTGKLAVLWSIDKVKLRGAVTPGDQLRIEVETIRSRPGMGHVQARCKVAGKLVAEAQLKFTLVDA